MQAKSRRKWARGGDDSYISNIRKCRVWTRTSRNGSENRQQWRCGVDAWKQSFLEKLNQAQRQCSRRFEEAMDRQVVPVFQEFTDFLNNNGFSVSTPLRESIRRSFKFELAENAYVLLIFRFFGVGELELRRETFIPGAEPILKKSVSRVADVNKDWARKRFQEGLDHLVELLAGGEGKRLEQPVGSATPGTTNDGQELVVR
jgi:hypothetical protein